MAKKWKQILKAVAPTLAGAIGTGAGGPMAGVAARAVARAITNDDDTDISLVGEVLELASPEELIMLKNAEEKFKLDMKALEVKSEETHADDTKNARERQKETEDKTPANLAYIHTFGFYAIAAFVLVTVPDLTLKGTIIGALITVFINGNSFFHGSSSGSKEKSSLLSKFKS